MLCRPGGSAKNMKHSTKIPERVLSVSNLRGFAFRPQKASAVSGRRTLQVWSLGLAAESLMGFEVGGIEAPKAAIIESLFCSGNP